MMTEHTKGSADPERLVRSRERVADHGEVFTPRWLVDDMIDLVADEASRIDSRFLEPACGSGNFLVAVLERKLASARKKHGRSAFEWRHSSLLALMSLYGIELLADNTAECRNNLHGLFVATLKVAPDDVWAQAARSVLAVNIVQGDALKMQTVDGRPIEFAEWAYLGRKVPAPRLRLQGPHAALTGGRHALRPVRRRRAVRSGAHLSGHDCGADRRTE